MPGGGEKEIKIGIFLELLNDKKVKTSLRSEEHTSELQSH